MPKPCAPSRVGIAAHSTSAYLTHARIRFGSGWSWRGGGIGWPTVALAPILVQPNPCQPYDWQRVSPVPRDLRCGAPGRGVGAGARAAARVRLPSGAPHPDPGTPAARGYGHAAPAHGGCVERAACRVRGGGGAAQARAAGAGVARELARALAAAAEACPRRAAALARAARRGRNSPHPVRRAAVDARTHAAIWRVAVRGPRVVPAPVRV